MSEIVAFAPRKPRRPALPPGLTLQTLETMRAWHTPLRDQLAAIAGAPGKEALRQQLANALGVATIGQIRAKLDQCTDDEAVSAIQSYWIFQLLQALRRGNGAAADQAIAHIGEAARYEE